MSTRQPSLLRKAISVLASFALAFAFVPTAWANTTEGAEGGQSAPEIDLVLSIDDSDDYGDSGCGTLEYLDPQTSSWVSLSLESFSEGGHFIRQTSDGKALFRIHYPNDSSNPDHPAILLSNGTSQVMLNNTGIEVSGYAEVYFAERDCSIRLDVDDPNDYGESGYGTVLYYDESESSESCGSR